MNFALLLILAAPTLYWDKGLDTAAVLKKNNLSTLRVPPANVEAWTKAGFDARAMSPADLEGLKKLADPGIDTQIATLSPTQRPFVVAHGWQFLRKPGGQYRYEPKPGAGAIAVAEAWAYDANAVVKIDAADVPAVGSVFSFFRRIAPLDLPDMSQIGIIDDGSETMGEVTELLSRRNLLFRPVSTRSPSHLLTIQLGTKEYPTKSAQDPSEFAYAIRGKISDNKRLLRIYGSETVICRLVGDKNRARLYFVNYGGNAIEGLRVRIRGAYPRGVGFSDLKETDTTLRDHTLVKGVAEFTVPSFKVIGVADLQTARP